MPPVTSSIKTEEARRLPPVRSIDIVTKTGRGVGAITIRGGGRSSKVKAEGGISQTSAEAFAKNLISKEAEAKTLARQNVITQRDAIQSDRSYALATAIKEGAVGSAVGGGYIYTPSAFQRVQKADVGPISYGAPFVTSAEAKQLQGTAVPFIEVKGKDVFGTIREAEYFSQVPQFNIGLGAFRGTQSEGVYKFNIAQIEAAKEIYTGATEKQMSVDPRFAFKVGQEKAEQQFSKLPLSEQYLSYGLDVGTGASKLAIETALFFPEVVKTSLLSGQIKPGEKPSLFGFERINIPGFAGKLREAPLGPGGKLAIATGIAVGAEEGLISAKSLYYSQRALGLGKAAALDIVGGETIASLSPVQLGRIQGTRIISGKGIGQVNQGDLIAIKQVGEFQGAKLYSGKGTGEFFKGTVLEYTSLTPRISTLGFTAERKAVALPQFGKTLLGPNLIAVGDIGGGKTGFIQKGQRDFFQFGFEPVQIGRYDIGARPFSTRTTEEFLGVGTGKVLGRKDGLDILRIQRSEFKFKPVEIESTFGGIISRKGKAFGLGIPGRPRIARSAGFSYDIASFQTKAGKSIFGETFDITKITKGFIPTQFKTFTFIPEKGGISISKSEAPKGFKIGITKEKSTGKFEDFSYLKSPKIKDFEPISGKQVTQQITSEGTINKQLSKQTGKFSETALKPSGFKDLQIPKISYGLKIGATSITSLVGGGLKAFSGQISTPSQRAAQSQFISPTTAIKPSQFFATSLIPSLAPSLTSGFGSFNIPPLEPFLPVTGFPPLTPSLGGYADRKIKELGRKANLVNIAPGFTSIVRETKITAPLKVSRTLGVTPFQTRGLLVTKKGRPAKGPYFKLTDI